MFKGIGKDITREEIEKIIREEIREALKAECKKD